MATKEELREYFELTEGRKPTLEDFQRATENGEISSDLTEAKNAPVKVDGPEPKKKSKKRKILLGGAGLLVLLAIVSFFFITRTVSNYDQGIDNTTPGILKSLSHRLTVYMDLNVHDHAQQLPDPAHSAQKIENPNYLKIDSQLKALSHVTKITFFSKEQALAALQKNNPKYASLYKGDANPLYDSYIVLVDHVSNKQEVLTAIEKIPGVDRVTE